MSKNELRLLAERLAAVAAELEQAEEKAVAAGKAQAVHSPVAYSLGMLGANARQQAAQVRAVVAQLTPVAAKQRAA